MSDDSELWNKQLFRSVPMKKLILMLLYSACSYADMDIELTMDGKSIKLDPFKVPYINIGMSTCGITTAKGQIIGRGHEPGESMKIECPGFISAYKTCRFNEATDSVTVKAWVNGWNSEDNEIYAGIDGHQVKIRMLCNVQH